MAEPFPLGPSLWVVTAPPAAETPPLDGDAETDVCVVGGGYCGLSAALHLVEAGTRVVVLEAREPGWGASGRNGGQVIPGLKYDPDDLERKFPGEAGEALVRFAGATADIVFGLIGRHDMNVPHVRAGWIQGAHTEAGQRLAESRARQWQRRGVTAEVLDRAQVAAKLGNNAYLGGWVDPRGGGVQPLAYARGIARAALSAGARIHGQSAAIRLEQRNGSWRIHTARGVVTARRVLVATNGYSDGLIPGLRRTVVAANSFQIATEPLSDNVRRSVLPEGHVSSDTRKLLHYCRLDHEGRLLFGGRGPFREPKGVEDWAHLERLAARMFPQIAGTPITHRWSGRVAITRDFLPHLHEPEPGLVADVGCMGRGVGLQTAMGQALARYLQSSDPRMLPFPILPIRPIPFHAMRRVYVSAMVAWYRFTDAAISEKVLRD